ncbi:MAG TPA: DUF4132 domain-containing protein [Verrucomicrobiae bacterium]
MNFASQEVAMMPADSALGPETREAFFHCLARMQDNLSAAYANVPPHVQKQIGISVIDRKEELFRLLQTLTIHDGLAVTPMELPSASEAWRPILEFLARPEIRPEHFVRWMLLFSVIRRVGSGDEPYVLDHKFAPLLNRFRHGRTFGLRELGMAFQAVGLDEVLLGCQQLRAISENPFPWPAEAIWPYWAGHFELLEQALQPGDDYSIKERRKHAFLILSKFPEPPPQFTGRLWGFAFSSKSERVEAQEALGSGPRVLQKLLAEIASNESERRTIAAEWLGRLNNPAAIEPLMTAVKDEKQVEPRNAMLIALELLDGPLETLLNRGALLREAIAGLSEGIPPELQWFPISTVPQIHWADTGEAVPAEIPQWWLIENFKLKNPEPGPLLRRYCAQFVPAERRALGRFVLDAWIAQEAHTRKGPIALTCKGTLAMAAACCGGEAASAAAQYLAKWPRERAGQCRALVQMLAWIDHPAATQLLLAVSSRFKPATIQSETQRLSLALARRKGWTVGQMADRAIPTAGLDERGYLQLSYGSRNFTARLNEQRDFVLTDNTGKIVKTLPAPRASDNQSLAQESKRAFAAAKKELKSILGIQRDRLYEAMCIQRAWSYEEWDACLHRHPVMRHLCQHLVWFATGSGQPPRFFQLLADGSLTDADDKPILLPADSHIAIAHGSTMTTEASRAWQQHLVDYEIEPLFPQFGFQGLSISAEQREQTTSCDFKGHIINAFALRGQAGKLGYARGRPMDGACFYEYLKTFSSLGIIAVISFTGNAMPEENRKVALTELHFSRASEAGQPLFDASIKMRLGDVPPVLLNECWNHMRQIAGSGSGFDPKWEEKTKI